jgi:hypothetical protein
MKKLGIIHHLLQVSVHGDSPPVVLLYKGYRLIAWCPTYPAYGYCIFDMLRGLGDP